MRLSTPDATAPTLLYVTTTPAIVRNFLVPYAAHFRAQGWRVHAAARGATELEVLREAFDGVHELPWSRSLRDPVALAQGFEGVRALSRNLRPDLVHVHSPIAGLVTRFALGRGDRRARPGVIYTAHGFHAHPGGRRLSNVAYSLMETVGGRWADALVVINDQDEVRARRWGMVGRRRLVRMPGIGIDTSHYDRAAVPDAAALDFRRATGIPHGAPLIVMIAELHRNKRPLDAVMALAAMTRTDAHLALLGEGPLAGEMHALAVRLGVEGRVHLCGFVPDVRPALASASAGLLTSEREGLPRAIMECLAMGVPVVSTDARGCRELVGAAGVLVPVGDVQGLAAALDTMDRMTPGWALMAAEGRRRMTADYGIERLVSLHEELYRRVLANRAPAPLLV